MRTVLDISVLLFFCGSLTLGPPAFALETCDDAEVLRRACPQNLLSPLENISDEVRVDPAKKSAAETVLVDVKRTYERLSRKLAAPQRESYQKRITPLKMGSFLRDDNPINAKYSGGKISITPRLLDLITRFPSMVWSILAHETGHCLDPTFDVKGMDPRVEFEKLIGERGASCFYQTSITDPAHYQEEWADWNEALALDDRIEEVLSDRRLRWLQEAMLSACYRRSLDSIRKRNPSPYDPHLPADMRIAKILRQPKLRRVLGCDGPPVTSNGRILETCDLDGEIPLSRYSE